MIGKYEFFICAFVRSLRSQFVPPVLKSIVIQIFENDILDWLGLINKDDFSLNIDFLSIPRRVKHLMSLT